LFNFICVAGVGADDGIYCHIIEIGDLTIRFRESSSIGHRR
jgi:hypothetical protein